MEEGIVDHPKEIYIPLADMMLDRLMVSCRCIDTLCKLPKIHIAEALYDIYQVPGTSFCFVSCFNQEIAHRLLALVKKKKSDEIISISLDPCVNLRSNTVDMATGFSNINKNLINYFDGNTEVSLSPNLVLKNDNLFINNPNLYFIELITGKGVKNSVCAPSIYVTQENELHEKPILLKSPFNNGEGRFTEIKLACILSNNGFYYDEDKHRNDPPQEVIEQGKKILNQHFSDNEISGWTFVGN